MPPITKEISAPTEPARSPALSTTPLFTLTSHSRCCETCLHRAEDNPEKYLGS